MATRRKASVVQEALVPVAKKEDDVEAPEDTSVNETFRNIKIINAANKEEATRKFNDDTNKRSPHEGTPHGTLLPAIQQCKDYLVSKGKWTSSDETEYVKYTKFLSNSNYTRESMDSDLNGVFTYVNNLLNTTINAIINKSNKETEIIKKEELLKLWSCFMYKGMSDISQYSALLMMLELIKEYKQSLIKPNIGNYSDFMKKTSQDAAFQFKSEYYGNTKIDETAFDALLRTWTLYQKPRILGVSSDIIASALMTNFSSLYGDSVLPILCTRKLKGNTAFVIVQNYRVIVLCEYLLSSLNKKNATIYGFFQDFCKNSDGISYIFNDQFDHDKIQLDFDELFRLREQMLKFGTNFTDAMFTILTTNIDSSKYDENTKFEIKRLRESKIYYKFFKLTALIQNIELFMHEIEPQFNQYAKQKWNEEMHNVEIPRYLYTIVSMVFELKNPLDIRSVDRDKVARTEFISATYDSTYGHDFNKSTKFSGVYNLGRQVLKSVSKQYKNVNEPILDHSSIVDDEDSRGNMETKCIIESLKRNKMGTISQNTNYFLCSLNPNNNYLTQDCTVASFDTKWNLFMSPLSFSPTITVIDFTSGVQPYQRYKAEIMNYLLNEMYGIKDPRQHHLFRITYPEALSNYVQKSMEDLQSNKQIIEAFLPTSYYDQAATYGLYPTSVTGDYITQVDIGDGIWFMSKTHSNKETTALSTAEAGFKIVGGVITTHLTNALNQLTPAERTKLVVPNDIISRFDSMWRMSALKLDKRLTMEDLEYLLGGFKYSERYMVFFNLGPNNPLYYEPASENIYFDPENHTKLMTPDKLFPTATPIDARKENFDMLMKSILSYILDDTVNNERKHKLLDIFEKAVHYTETREQIYLREPTRTGRQAEANKKKVEQLAQQAQDAMAKQKISPVVIVSPTKRGQAVVQYPVNKKSEKMRVNSTSRKTSKKKEYPNRVYQFAKQIFTSDDVKSIEARAQQLANKKNAPAPKVKIQAPASSSPKKTPSKVPGKSSRRSLRLSAVATELPVTPAQAKSKASRRSLRQSGIPAQDPNSIIEQEAKKKAKESAKQLKAAQSSEKKAKRLLEKAEMEAREAISAQRKAEQEAISVRKKAEQEARKASALAKSPTRTSQRLLSQGKSNRKTLKISSDITKGINTDVIREIIKQQGVNDTELDNQVKKFLQYMKSYDLLKNYDFTNSLVRA